MKAFAGIIQATKTTSFDKVFGVIQNQHVQSVAVSVTAKSEYAARDALWQACRDRFQPADGWHSHAIGLSEFTPEQMNNLRKP